MLVQHHTISTNRIASLTASLDSLIKATSDRLGTFAKQGTIVQGVYVISDPDDAEVVYVGRTIKALEGLRQRIRDHIKNSEPSDLNQKLGGDRDLAANHNVRVLPISDADERRLTEAFATGVLNPKFNM